MTRAAVSSTSPAASGATHDPRRYRPDIEGLRLVAVALVIGYHSGIPYVAGGFVGVDVFFVISGFLITGLLVEELRQRGTLSFAGFYARRARRLLPMALLVLAVTAVAFAVILSPLDRQGLARDIEAATLYVGNWHFAASSLVYGTDASVNPVLHYWSLSVEEQFYVIWPALLFLVARVRPPGAVGLARRVAVGLVVLGAASLVASIVLTPRSAPYAYYGLHTRAWEFAAGGLLVLASDRVRRAPAWLHLAMGWTGLAAITVAVLRFGPGTTFPGAAAVLPVAGTVLVMAAGAGQTWHERYGVGRVLALRPVTYGGRLSYSLYLWHWPCLILAGTLTADGSGPFAVAGGGWVAVAIAATVVLSVVSHHALENPARFSAWLRPRGRTLALAAAAMAGCVGLTALVLPTSSGAIRTPVLAYVAPLPASHLRGASAGSDSPLTHVTLRMTPAGARDDRPVGAGSCYADYTATTAPAGCVFGDPDGDVSIALVGDSVAQALFPALDEMARANHWKLWLWTKPACPLIALSVRLPQFHDSYPWCTSWQASVMSRLAAIPHLRTVFVTNYGGVLTIPGRFGDPGGVPLSAQAMPAAWQQAWRRTDEALSAVTRRVVVIRSTPMLATDVPRCLVDHVPDERACSTPRSRALAAADRLERIERAGSTATTRFVGLDQVLCPGDPCPVVTAGGDIIYRDDRHLTATVSGQLATALDERVRQLSAG